MQRLRGRIGIRGRVAFVPQQAWIQNQSVRYNITFGAPFEEYFYGRVLDACALYQDLAILSHGDMTEIGEKVVETLHRIGGSSQFCIHRCLAMKKMFFHPNRLKTTNNNV
jgi:hypothetical protein